MTDNSTSGRSARTVVVVGAAQGIGETVARYLAPGNEIVLADIKGDLVETVAADLRSQGHAATSMRVDLTNPESVQALVAATSTASKVAIVAGAFSAGPSVDATPADFNRILAVNLVGVFDVARSYAKRMSRSPDGTGGDGGAIVAIGSIAARMPRIRQAAYSASKAGMRQALRVLGAEVLPFGVRINFVAPGPTATPMMAELSSDHEGVKLWDGELETSRPRILDGRVGTPDDVAAAVEFLLSDRASHIGLHDLYVDGGETLGM